jgi:diguanylate cyclase (GGDEF)-like protein
LAVTIAGTAVAVTVSIGLAVVEAEREDWETVLRRADEALYRAKDQGRNRIEIA